jgi:hypothetical protein
VGVGGGGSGVAVGVIPKFGLAFMGLGVVSVKLTRAINMKLKNTNRGKLVFFLNIMLLFTATDWYKPRKSGAII